MTLAERIAQSEGCSLREAEERLIEADYICFVDDRPILIADRMHVKFWHILVWFAGSAITGASAWWILHILTGGLL